MAKKADRVSRRFTAGRSLILLSLMVAVCAGLAATTTGPKVSYASSDVQANPVDANVVADAHADVLDNVDANAPGVVNPNAEDLGEVDPNQKEEADAGAEPNAPPAETLDLQDVTPGGEIQSIVFQKNMDMCDALLLLAARYRKNIVPSPAVQGKLAFVNLYNVRFEEAMDAILGTDYKYEQQGNLIKVYPLDKGQMVHKVFTLYYIRAAEAQKLVQQVLSSGAKLDVTTAAEIGVPFDTAIGGKPVGGDTTAMNDTLIVCDYPENIKKAEEVIRAVDVCPKQVLVEATVLSAALTENMQFGIDWQTLEGPVISQLADLTAGSPDFLRSEGSSARVGGDSLDGGMRIGIVHNDVAAFIKAVEQVTDVTVLANPKILAVNKQLGQIYIGKKIAYQSQTTQTDVSTTEQVQFLETGTKLSFRPYVGNDGLIRMDVHPKDSSATLRTAGTSTLPDETSAELATNIIVKDGQTILIGGLFRDKITTTRTQIPVLGDLPLVGALFRGKADEVQREEVIVLLTPHIIHDPNEMSKWTQENSIESKKDGAEKELQRLNRIRHARDCYKAAVEYYVEGDDKAAMKELDAALRLYPAYLEAIRLEEMIAREQQVKKLRMGK